MKVLIIEDDLRLLNQLKSLLESDGYAVEASADGEDGEHLGLEFPFDAAIVDIGLANRNGIEIVQEWRKKNIRFPVMMLTARGRWQEKVSGLESGADDYMVKPAEPQELLARLRAIMRRSGGWTTNVLDCGIVSLNTSTKEVLVKRKAVELTAYEFRVLEYLMLHSGKVVSKAELSEHVYAQEDDRDSNTLEVFVRRLRSKLDPDDQLLPIETLRGQGYRFTLKKPS